MSIVQKSNIYGVGMTTIPSLTDHVSKCDNILQNANSKKIKKTLTFLKRVNKNIKQ